MDSEHSVLFSSGDPEERRRATAELVELDSGAVAEQVIIALADEDWRVRKEAIAVALALAPSPVLLERLVNAFLPSDNVGLRNAAVEALGGYGEAAVQALAAKMPAFDADGRKLAVEALGRSGQTSALPVLAQLLTDSDVNVRAAAAEAIASIGSIGGGDAAPLLERCLLADEALVSLAALDGLNAMGAVLPWRVVAGCLERPSLRRAALLAAGRSADSRAIPVLIEALGSARGALLADVVTALRDFVRDPASLPKVREGAESLSPRAREELLRLITDEDAREAARRAALVVVGALGFEGAADCAVAALGDDRFLSEAHEALELLSERALKALVHATRSADAVARGSSLGLLARLETPTLPASAIEAARDALSDVVPEVQSEALAVLSRYGDADCLVDVGRSLAPEGASVTAKAAESALRQLSLRCPDEARRLVGSARPDAPDARAACVIIGALARDQRETDAELAFLSSALSNSSGSVRSAAVEALASVGGARAVSAVAFALADEEQEVRRMAVAALGKIRGEDGSAPGVPHLIDLVQRAHEADLVAAAARALGEAGDHHALAVLRPLIRSPQAFVAVSAVEALAELAGARRVESLLDGLSHSDAEVVKATMLALSDAPDPRVVAHLGACLDHDAWDVRRLAADLLGRISGETALGLLRARLSGEDSPPVQAAISRALERAAGQRRSLPPGGSLRPR
ncbi:MAG: HEAT repeat domain-containing protein [Myxococcota bacterium]